jgi:hypothetical protein
VTLGPDVLVMLTLPGLVIVLTVLAAIEHVLSRLGRRSMMHRRPRHRLSTTSLDVLTGAVLPGKANELEQRRIERQLRDDAQDGAPPGSRIDLKAGTAYLRIPRTAPDPSRRPHP